MMLAWFLVVQLSLADLQIGHRLYVSYVAFDHSVRVPFVEAAARNGVPPLNPFYGLGKAPVLRYFYYWYVVCALPMQLFGLSARGVLQCQRLLERRWIGFHHSSFSKVFPRRDRTSSQKIRDRDRAAYGHRSGSDSLCRDGLPLSCFVRRIWNGGIRTRSPPGWARCCGCRTTWRRLLRAWRGCSYYPQSTRTIRFDKEFGPR